MKLYSSVATATFPRIDLMPVDLVARLNFRRSESGWLDTPEAGTVRGKIRTLILTQIAQPYTDYPTTRGQVGPIDATSS
jgi:hypothetical protein